MRKLHKIVPVALCLAFFLICWAGSLFLAQRLGVIAGGVSVRYSDGGGISPSDISRVLRYAEEDGNDSLPGMTLWREKRGQSLSAEGFRSAQADLLEIFGDGSHLLPIKMRAGSLPTLSDTVGCAIDESVAHALWGSVDVLGKSLTYQGVTYTVRGVFRGAKNLMMIQADKGSEALYPALFLSFPQGEGGGTDRAREFLSQNGFSAGEILDVPLLSWAMRFLAELPALVLLLCLLGKLIKKAFQLRHTYLLFALFLVPAAGTAVFALWAAGLPALPDQLLPTQWSDFAYWGRFFGQCFESLAAAFRLPLTTRDIALWMSVLGGGILAPAAGVLSVFAVNRVKPRSLIGWGVCTAFWFTGVFIAAVLFMAAGGVDASRGFWLIVPVFWACGGWMRAFDESLKKKDEA